MIIVYVNPFYTDGMGYIENCLPREMAKRGHKVYIISSTGKVYFDHPLYTQTYEGFAGPPIVEPGTYQLDGNVELRRLDFVKISGGLYLKGLNKILEEIRPDVVQLFDVIAPFTVQFFMQSKKLGFNVYTANSYHLSVLEVHKQWGNVFSALKYKWLLFKVWPGKLLSKYYIRCYANAADTKFVAEKYMGVPPSKCVVAAYGVDTDSFAPASDEEKALFRKKLDLNENDFVAIYTGRFSRGKNALLLAQAIDKLQQEGYHSIKGLFVGTGEDKDLIKQCKGAKVVDFVPFYELNKYYQCADVGVWPAQESTSALDAAAVGIPVIMNNTVKATNMFEGNGLTFEIDNADNLAAQLLKLFKDPELRNKLGKEGIRKITQEYSWKKIAGEREADYLRDKMNK